MKKLFLFISFLTVIVLLSGCIQQSETQKEENSQTELHFTLPYCSYEFNEGIIGNKIDAGIHLFSKNGNPENVVVIYTLKDLENESIVSKTHNIVNEIPVGDNSDAHINSIEIDVDLETVLKIGELKLGEKLPELPLIIEVYCSNCKIIGDCVGCVNNKVEINCS